MPITPLVREHSISTGELVVGGLSWVKIEMQMLCGAQRVEHSKYFKNRRLSQKQTRDMYCPATIKI